MEGTAISTISGTWYGCLSPMRPLSSSLRPCVVLNITRNSGDLSTFPCHLYTESTSEMVAQAARPSWTAQSAVLAADSRSGYVESMMAGSIQ